MRTDRLLCTLLSDSNECRALINSLLKLLLTCLLHADEQRAHGELKDLCIALHTIPVRSHAQGELARLCLRPVSVTAAVNKYPMFVRDSKKEDPSLDEVTIDDDVSVLVGDEQQTVDDRYSLLVGLPTVCLENVHLACAVTRRVATHRLSCAAGQRPLTRSVRSS
jgi:hypothetical protein